ncbi:MAG TPA: hypothetical protein VKU84_17320 [Stellaceae bacterium]|nr:hypothetical protein [Stellaceae bacterium]
MFAQKLDSPETEGPCRASSATLRFALAAAQTGLFFAGAVIGCLVLFENKGLLDLVVQSDSLLPASVAWDYWNHDYALSGFPLSTAPDLIPDYLVYVPVQLATSSWRWAVLAYGAVSLLALASLAGLIVRDITGCKWHIGAQSALLVLLGVLFLQLPVTEPTRHHFFWLFQPTCHGGSFILSLATLIVARRWLERPATPKLALLLGLIFAGALSDLLFLITAVGALIAAMALGVWRRRISPAKFCWTLGYITASVVAARLADLSLSHEKIEFVFWATFREHALAFLSDLGEIANAAPLTVLLTSLVPLLIFAGFPWIAKRAAGRDGVADHIEFWWTASIVSTIVTVLVIPLRYVDIEGLRYAYALLWWPLIWTAAALVWAVGSAARYGFAAMLAGAIIALSSSYFWRGPHAPALLTLQEPLEVCIENGVSSAGLNAGLAAYWQARRIEAFSDWRLQVDQINEDGSAELWINDRHWYSHDIHDATRPPEYNYIVMAHVDESAIRVNYGPPSRTLECGGTAFWIYDDPESVRRTLFRLSPRLGS